MAPATVSFPPTTEFMVAPEAYYSSGLRARFLVDADRTAAVANRPAIYAKIGYEVDEIAYKKRVQASLAAGNLPTKVPAGWPTQLSGPLVWKTGDFPDENEYVYYLTDEHKLEISRALEIFKGSCPSFFVATLIESCGQMSERTDRLDQAMVSVAMKSHRQRFLFPRSEKNL